MDEFRSYSVLNFVRSQSASDLCRFVFCANVTISTDQVLKFFARCTRENSSNNVTGILLVNPRCLVHLLESTEDEIFRICSHFVNAEAQVIGNSKCFPMQIGVSERFFGEWHARAIAADCHAAKIHDENLSESFDDLTEIYSQLIENLYNFCNELGASRIISRACFINKLDSLVNKKDFRLPEVRTLETILQSRWGESLDEFVEDYYRATASSEVEQVVWPFPANQCPPIDTTR